MLEFIFQSIFFQFTVQRCTSYPEQLGGNLAVSVRLLQRTQNPLLVFSVVAQGEADGRGLFRYGKFQMLFCDKPGLRLQHRTHDFLPKLTDIARPNMGQQCFTGFPSNPITSHSSSLFAISRKNSASGMMSS